MALISAVQPDYVSSNHDDTPSFTSDYAALIGPTYTRSPGVTVMNMRTLFLSVLGLLLAGASITTLAAQAQSEKAYCSLKTLKGSYTYSIQGYRNKEAYASSGLFTFNGAGEVGVLYTSSIERTQLSVTGTYTVNGDCSGTMILAGKTVVNNFYLSPSGDHFSFVRVSSNDVIGTEARRVSRDLLIKQP